ncbi:MAG: beta-ketoacyl synthase, partial [Flavobacteriales bacterium]
GVEAPLTDFTFAQFEALRLMSTEKELPCHPLSTKLNNTMVIGEGAGLVKLAAEKSSQSKWEILGLGQALESAKHLVGIEGEALENSMERALESSGLERVDAVLAHAPGTKLGDEVEKAAVKKLLGEVEVLSNKWAFGHTFGASGVMSLIWAGWLLDGWKPEIPPAYKESHQLSSVPQSIMINAIGFGGSAVSIVLGKA